MIRKLALAAMLVATLGVGTASAATGSMTGPSTSTATVPVVHVRCSTPGGPRDVTLCLAASGPTSRWHPIRYFLQH